MSIKTVVFSLFFIPTAYAQSVLQGEVRFPEVSVPCRIGLRGTSLTTTSDTTGRYQLTGIPAGQYTAYCSCPGFEAISKPISITAIDTFTLAFDMRLREESLSEISVIGTIRETVRSESPIVTDIYDKKYFEKNPVSNMLDLMDRMNGVRPQVNCNVCGTGDIHINGLEGPYTLIVLDGIPMMGGLSSVYGLSGIPAFLLDKIEVTKGPASSLYGSEAVAGVIHAFTKKASKTPEIHWQQLVTSHGEINTDLGVNLLIGRKTSVFTSGSHYLMQQRLDQNNDHFTDVPLQNRFSVYQKWKTDRKFNRIFTVSGRVLQEDRWGGELNWNPSFRGGDSIYAESIRTERQEFNIAYQLPFKEKILFLGHFNRHFQDSYYGTTYFRALQQLSFAQLTWDKKINRHQLLTGANIRHTFYNDNTTITSAAENIQQDQPLNTFLPGIFVQDQYKPNDKTTLLGSARLDHHPIHGFIFTPRLAALYRFNPSNTLRIHAGSGFRVVNLFSEDHAALTGARQVEITEDLAPEKSKSINLSYSNSTSFKESWTAETDLSIFYTRFSNRIIADYETDPNKIIYSNLNGSAVSQGISLDLKISYEKTFSLQAGVTFMDVSINENGQRTQQILTEKVSGNWTASYSFKKIPLTIDYTGNFVGPMRLPVLGELDPRPVYSRTYSLQNIQLSYTFSERFVVFGGVKNLLNWTPARNTPFLISRSEDPFDKNVTYDSDGQILATAVNPYGLSFDPSYVYAPNQGIRGFAGFRMKLGLKGKKRN